MITFGERRDFGGSKEPHTVSAKSACAFSSSTSKAYKDYELSQPKGILFLSVYN